MSISRRQLLGAIGAGWLSEPWLRRRQPITGRIVGNSHATGHLLRRHGSPHRGRPPSAARPPRRGPTTRTDVVVVGGGVSGLSAAWRLRDTGLEVQVLELADRVGGTSTWDDDGAVPHPWGGHYLPAPNSELGATQRLLAELGVLTGWDAAGRPLFDPEMLCHAPEERIFYGGHWFPGLVPWPALTSAERHEMQRFRELEQELTAAKGRDGRYAFQLPFDQSSRDPRFLELDRISMAEWLRREELQSPFLRWYVRYATLDDFGAELEEVSAWAALHYFAARKLRTEQLAGSNYLVWPEGNGWLVRRESSFDT